MVPGKKFYNSRMHASVNQVSWSIASMLHDVVGSTCPGHIQLDSHVDYEKRVQLFFHNQHDWLWSSISIYACGYGYGASLRIALQGSTRKVLNLKSWLKHYFY